MPETNDAVTLPTDTIPCGPGPRFTVHAWVSDPNDPHGGDLRDVNVAQGTSGINVGLYSWNFDEAERLALAMLASVRSGRDWQRRWHEATGAEVPA